MVARVFFPTTRCGLTPLHLVVVLAGCVQTERVAFDIELVQKPCLDRHADVSRVELMLIPIDSQGRLCLLKSAEVTPGQRASRVLEGGALPDSDEVVLAALGYADQGCVRCQALARVLLDAELTRYALDLVPTEQCALPAAALAGLGLPSDPLPPATCSP